VAATTAAATSAAATATAATSAAATAAAATSAAATAAAATSAAATAAAATSAAATAAATTSVAATAAAATATAVAAAASVYILCVYVCVCVYPGTVGRGKSTWYPLFTLVHACLQLGHKPTWILVGMHQMMLNFVVSNDACTSWPSKYGFTAEEEQEVTTCVSLVLVNKQ